MPPNRKTTVCNYVRLCEQGTVEFMEKVCRSTIYIKNEDYITISKFQKLGTDRTLSHKFSTGGEAGGRAGHMGGICLDAVEHEKSEAEVIIVSHKSTRG